MNEQEWIPTSEMWERDRQRERERQEDLSPSEIEAGKAELAKLRSRFGSPRKTGTDA